MCVRLSLHLISLSLSLSLSRAHTHTLSQNAVQEHAANTELFRSEIGTRLRSPRTIRHNNCLLACFKTVREFCTGNKRATFSGQRDTKPKAQQFLLFYPFLATLFSQIRGRKFVRTAVQLFLFNTSTWDTTYSFFSQLFCSITQTSMKETWSKFVLKLFA